MASPVPLALALLVPAQQGSLHDLESHWRARSSSIYERDQGDAPQQRQIRDLARDVRDRAWKWIRSRPSGAPEDAWRFLFGLDHQADDPKAEGEHARSCLTRVTKGSLAALASYHLARSTILQTAKAAEEDAELERFAAAFPEAVLERGQLLALAAEEAVDLRDFARAGALYGKAIALPKSQEELESEKKDPGGRSQHTGWSDRKERLALFTKSFDDFGGEDLAGKQVRIKDLRGKVVLIEFWASW